MAKEKKVESVEPIEMKEEVKAETFVERKLKAINEMQKPMKAQRVAHRLLRKARNN